MIKDRNINIERVLISLALIITMLAYGSACFAGVATYQLDAGISCPARVSYWLSGDATSVTIKIIDATTSEVAYTFPTITGTNASKGFHSNVVTWNGESNSGGNVAPGLYKVCATVVAPGTGTNTNKMAPIWESVKADGSSDGWRVYGIAMNNNPNSPFYGRVYVGNYQNNDGRTKAVWEFNPDGTVIGTLPTTDGVYDPIFGPSGPWGLCVDWSGDVYVSNRSAASSGGAGPGVWCYHWNGTAWTISSKISGISNDRYLGCSMQSGPDLKLIDTYYASMQPSATSRLYAGIGDPPTSFAQVGTDRISTDCMMQPAIDTDGTVYVAGINKTRNVSISVIGALTKWDMNGNFLGRNTHMSQVAGCCLTPDAQNLWLARPVGPYGGNVGDFEDPYDTSGGNQADKCIYKLPKSEVLTAVAYPTPSANLKKFGLQTAYTGGGLNMPRFISADGASNLAIASMNTDVATLGAFFGLYKEPTGTTPTVETRVSRNAIEWNNDYSPEFVSGSTTPSPVACGSSVTVTVVASDINNVYPSKNDIDSCKIYCPALGVGLAGDPNSGYDMQLVSGPDEQKRNTYSITIPIPSDAPTGQITANIYIYDVDSEIQPCSATMTIAVTGGYIKGVITEGITGHAAAGVKVRATKGDFYREAITDETGTYTIDVTPNVGYSVAPVTNNYGNTTPTEYNLQSNWPDSPGLRDWPKSANVYNAANTTVSGRVWPLAITQATYDWNTQTYRLGGRTVCVTGTVLRQAADSSITPNQKGYAGYYFITDMLGGANHNLQQALKVKVYSKGSECKNGDKVIVIGTFNVPANYNQGIITPTSPPVVLSSYNSLPVPTNANSLTRSALYSNLIGGWYVMTGKTVTRVGTNGEFYVQVPDTSPTSEFRIDMNTMAITGIGYPTVGQVIDIYGVLDEMAVWNTLRAIRPGQPGDAGMSYLVSDTSSAKALADGSEVSLNNAQVTVVAGGGVPNDTAYIEEPNRTNGLRIFYRGLPPDIGTGDRVFVYGKMATSALGERQIEASVFRRVYSNASARPIDAMGMNNRDAARSNALGLFIKTWGKVINAGDDYFTITDGSPAPIKVMCGSLSKPDVGKVVRVRGVVSKDASGPILLMRNEQVDWAYGDADYHPLPFAGAYKYARDFLVLGPFADENSVTVAEDPITSEAYRLDHDFIADATGGLLNENAMTNLMPSLGGSVGSYTWQRSQCVGDNADFVSVFTTNNTDCTFYAHIWVYSPIDQIVAMRVGSDDSVKVMVNGIEFWRNLVNDQSVSPPTAGRSETQGEDAVPYIILNMGFNSVLFKVEQGSVYAGVDCQFVNASNTGMPGWGGATPLEGLGYVLSLSQ